MRQDATIVVYKCHNFLHLPVGMDDALAETRGYRISLVLAHQHLAQLPTDIAHAVDANARNKIYFTVSPEDARHTAPVFDDYDVPDPSPGREALIRRAARGNAGLTDAQRRHARHRLLLDAAPPPDGGTGPAIDRPVATRTR